jgi:hypothetical protein
MLSPSFTQTAYDASFKLIVTRYDDDERKYSISGASVLQCRKVLPDHSVDGEQPSMKRLEV